jgi:hypothetical protein
MSQLTKNNAAGAKSARVSGADLCPKSKFENAGILCVFQVLQTAKLGQKIRQAQKTVFSLFPKN